MKRDLNNFLQRFENMDKMGKLRPDISFTIRETEAIMEMAINDIKRSEGYISFRWCMVRAITISYKIAFVIGYEKAKRECKRKGK